MCRWIAPVFIFIMFISCNSEGSGTDKTSQKDITLEPAYKEGLALVAKNQCANCHRVDQSFTGPTYRDIANKYADKPDTIIPHLAGKIIKGGNGVWGEIFMLPHPGIPQQDAEAMIRYILLLKK